MEVEKFFDRSRSAISLLGTFNVRDKDGNDITGAFTPRLKSLLVLLVLYTEKNKQGILTKKLQIFYGQIKKKRLLVIIEM